MFGHSLREVQPHLESWEAGSSVAVQRLWEDTGRKGGHKMKSSCGDCQWSHPDTCRMCRAEQDDLPAVPLKQWQAVGFVARAVQVNWGDIPLVLAHSVLYEIDSSEVNPN